MRTCPYKDCTRPARKGWTNCNRHYSAGRCLAQDRRAKAFKGYRLTRARLKDLVDYCVIRYERNVEACIRLRNDGSAPDAMPKKIDEPTVSDVIATLANRDGYEWLDGGLIRSDREKIADAANAHINRALRAGGGGLRFVRELARMIAEKD